ncbi:hypothetical protein LguiA_019077 [Lonicera macranthoides]
MSLENEDQSLPDEAPETLHESQKQSKISYTRDFLLSLSELDICKKLPRGFDHSILSEFEDASHDRQRVPGSLLQGYRRNDYSSSPPTRGDSSNYSRGTYGRWDNRSSGRNDKDSDSQSDWDSESGRRYGNQSRRSWQSTEHDGLLGSGSFPRPSGYAAGVSAPNVRSDEQPQLKKSNEPYQPPRPYKAVPHSRREIIESLDDETFGSTEVTSQDRAEEERKRRAAFELMRKEQHKALQEKQKLNLGKPKDDFLSDLTGQLEQTKEEKRPLERNKELDGSGTLPSISINGSGNSFSSQTLAQRPLVPPGFTSTILEKNSGPKSSVHTHEKEIGTPELAARLLDAKANPLQNGIIDNQEERSVHRMSSIEQQPDDNIIHSAFPDKNEKIVKSSYGFEVSKKKLGSDENSPLEGQQSLGNGEIVDLTSKKVEGVKIVSDSDSNKDNSTSILDKLFGSALTVNTGVPSSFVEHHDSKPDDTWSPNAVPSSKFAQWFLEEEKKPADDLSLGRPSDLLSLIVGGEKGGPHVSDMTTTHQNLPEFTILPTSGVSDQFNDCNNRPEAVPSVLTCEDLEQAILSEYSDKSSNIELPVKDSSVSNAETLQRKAKVDNHASQHLLSLLQKGTSLKETSPSTNLDIGSSEKQGNIGTVFEKPRGAEEKDIGDSGKTITLETLFGTAFMKELQSVEAPVSVHRVPLVEDGLFTSNTIDEVESSRVHLENNVLSSNQKDQQPKFEKIENWLRFDDPHMEVDPSKYQTEVNTNRGGFDGPVEIQLPEEESLITVNSMFGNSTKGDFLSSKAPINIEEKLAVLNVGFNDERRSLAAAHEGPPFARGPYDLMGPERVGPERMGPERQYHNMHAQSSSRMGPFRPLDSHPAAHINSQMKFMGPESIGQRNSPPNNQFPASMMRPPFQHPNPGGPTRFDLPAHHQMLQQMQIQGNFPPPHLLHEFSRGAPLHHHLSNNVASGFMQEANPMQGFPFGNRQPNIGGLGMPLAGGDASGSNHPEALQMLIGMDVRANSKQQQQQIHPPPPYGQGMYGHELDMGFRYR